MTQVALSFLRNFDQRRAPAGFTPLSLLKLFGLKLAPERKKEWVAQSKGWEFMWIGSMWFQDLWTYDFAAPRCA